MGNLTAKTSGEIASFMSPAKTNIKSLKVHFSPKQLGTGDPSPENIREIVGWDGVEVNGSRKNIAHIFGYGTQNISDVNVNKYKTTNGYGTKINTTTFNTPDTLLIIEQSQAPNTTVPSNYQNGYIVVGTDNLIFGKIYNVSFKISNITNNLLNIDYSKYIRILVPDGTAYSIDEIVGNTLIFKDIKFNQNLNTPIRQGFEIRICGMSFTLSEFMVTPVDKDNFDFEPYQGNNISTDWSSEIDTVYGGYVDLISGELVEEWGMFTVDEPDTKWRVAAYNRITINFPRKYIFGSRLLKDKSMCTILPENHTDWNYGYIDNVASITSPHALSLNYTGNGEGWSELFGEEVTNENVKSHLQELGFAICATLVEPITHQLTPIQLKSFVGQNNFWSNADYVEIEYDLIETEDIQKCRKKIILNQPQLKTISDKVVSFNTDMVAPLKNCKIYFKPIQLGTGDPSPTNVRNINGWTGLDSYVNGNKVSVDWTNDIGTVYGGYVDLVKGELVATQVGVRKKLSEATTKGQNSNGVYQYSFNFAIPYGQILNKYGSQKCSVCGYSWNMSDFQQNHFFGYYSESTGNRFLLFLLEDHGLNDDAEIDFMSELTSPVTFQLTSQQLLTFKSTNHIWSETNGQQIDVNYWSRKNLTPTPLTDYLENQTWTDSAYISSSGKKTTNTVSASHFLTNQILLEAGTYVLSGFSYYAGSDGTRYRIHAYDSTGKWVKQITFQEIDNLSPVDISFTLDTDTYVNVSIAMDFDGVLAKIN